MRGLGKDFTAAPLSTFNIVYEIIAAFVLFHQKEGQLCLDMKRLPGLLWTYIPKQIIYRSYPARGYLAGSVRISVFIISGVYRHTMPSNGTGDKEERSADEFQHDLVSSH